MTDVVVVIGAGSIGQAIVRRVSAGKQVLLADMRQENADAAAKIFSNAGFNVTIAMVDVLSRPSVHALAAAAANPPETILKVDLCGTALVLEQFGSVIARGGAGLGGVTAAY